MPLAHKSRLISMAVAITVAICLSPLASAGEEGGDAALPNPFFAYCVGYGPDTEGGTAKAQLDLPPTLAELGYDGTASFTLDLTEELLQALEAKGQKLFAVYTAINVDPDQKPYDPRLKQLIPKLKGHGTVVWLTVNSKAYKPSSTDGDGRAVEILRELSDFAKPYGVTFSLYPHIWIYAERFADNVRIAKKVDRDNVGVTFTLCHYMARDEVANIDRALEEAASYLTMVTINGTSGYTEDRATWILTLDQGTFDLAPMLKTLRRLNFQGPIGYIAFGIKGERRDILARSIEAWKKLSAAAAKP